MSMKLFSKPETAADFGITHTGRKLKEFNRRFRHKHMENSISAKENIKVMIFLLVISAINVYISTTYADGPIMTAVLLAAPVITLCAAIWTFFIKDITVRQMARRLAMGIQFTLLLLSGTVISSGGSCGTYLLYAAMGIAGIVYGTRSWAKQARRMYGGEESTFSGRLTTGILFAVGAVTVPIIRAFKDEKAVLSLLMTISLPALYFMFAWITGIAITNIRYYRFINRK